MSDALGSIGSFFGSQSGSAGAGLGDLFGLGTTGAGLVGNLMADKQRSAATKAAQANMNLTPAQLGAQVTQATQPLDQGLVQAITGNVNANMAEQGLSQAPGLQAQAIAQGLAGPEQQNQQQALQLVMAKLGLPAELLKSIPPNSPLAPMLALLMKNMGGGAGGQGNNPFGVPANTPAQAYGMGPQQPPPITDASTAGGGTQGNYDFGSLTDPGSTG